MSDDNKGKVQDNPNDLLNISLKESEGYIGDTITGEIIINTGDTILFRDVVLKLQLSEGYLVELNSNEKKAEINNKILKEQPLYLQRIVKSLGGMLTLNQGKYKFQFSFVIPEDAPPVFEYPKLQTNGFIRISLIAELLSESRPARAEKPIAIKGGPINTNDPLFKIDIQKIKMLGFIGKGNCSLTGSYDSNNYKLGDNIPISVEVNNTNCELDVQKLKVNFVRKITFFDKDKKPIYTKEKKISVTKNHVLIQREIKRFSYIVPTKEEERKEFDDPDFVICYPSISDISDLLVSTESDLVKCEYFIKITAYFSSIVTFKYRPRVLLPVYIVHLNLQEFQKKKAQEARMKMNLNSNIINQGVSNYPGQNEVLNSYNRNLNQQYNYQNMNNRNMDNYPSSPVAFQGNPMDNGRRINYSSNQNFPKNNPYNNNNFNNNMSQMKYSMNINEPRNNPYSNGNNYNINNYNNNNFPNNNYQKSFTYNNNGFPQNQNYNNGFNNGNRGPNNYYQQNYNNNNYQNNKPNFNNSDFPQRIQNINNSSYPEF